MQSFWIAVQFLTRLPVPADVDYSNQHIRRSVLTYPLVGLLIGIILVVVNLGLFYFSTEVRAGLILLIWVLITGGLHLDGLADSADGWLGGQGDRRRTHDIMQDPHVGAAAVISVTLLLMLKFVALGVLLDGNHWQVLCLAPVLGRAAVIALFLTTPYAKDEGLGKIPFELLSKNASIVTLVLIGVIIFVSLGVFGLGLILSLMIMGYLLRKLMLRRLGGTTGDTAGAMIEIIETTVLITLTLY